MVLLRVARAILISAIVYAGWLGGDGHARETGRLPPKSVIANLWPRGLRASDASSGAGLAAPLRTTSGQS